MIRISDFTPGKPFLVCIDSDGCVMDTMDVKHYRCFGPCMVTEWHLDPWKDAILDRWNQINLYSLTRGINRFKGLALALTEIDAKYTPIEGLKELKDWAEQAPELSNAALSKAAETAQGPCLAKALAWSNQVNAAIGALPESDKKPFAGAAKGLASAHSIADVAIVSSANREAVEEEWNRCGLLDSVDILCCQDAGTKASCIAQLKAKGYEEGHILMVGDAPDDLDAARKNGVFFYPILVRNESESWEEFVHGALPALAGNQYASYEEKVIARFTENLSTDQ